VGDFFYPAIAITISYEECREVVGLFETIRLLNWFGKSIRMRYWLRNLCVQSWTNGKRAVAGVLKIQPYQPPYNRCIYYVHTPHNEEC